ncbi:MAG: NACHT domain-containing protein [Gammaproteobacteria bacterium]
MVLETISFEKAVSLAAPLAKKLFVKHILPVAKSRASKFFRIKYAEGKFELASTRYLARVAGQCSILNTIAFQNAPKALAELYVPLTIESRDRPIQYRVDDQADIFAQSRHVLVNDTAGMGKSTLAKKVVSNILNGGKSVPIFIEMHQVGAQKIEEQVLDLFGLPHDLGADFLNSLPLVYVFDGLDEVPAELKPKVVKHLQAFVELVDAAPVLITTRRETFLSEFYDFAHCAIRPLAGELRQYSRLVRGYRFPDFSRQYRARGIA